MAAQDATSLFTQFLYEAARQQSSVASITADAVAEVAEFNTRMRGASKSAKETFSALDNLKAQIKEVNKQQQIAARSTDTLSKSLDKNSSKFTQYSLNAIRSLRAASEEFQKAAASSSAYFKKSLNPLENIITLKKFTDAQATLVKSLNASAGLITNENYNIVKRFVDMGKSANIMSTAFKDIETQFNNTTKATMEANASILGSISAADFATRQAASILLRDAKENQTKYNKVFDDATNALEKMAKDLHNVDLTQSLSSQYKNITDFYNSYKRSLRQLNDAGMDSNDAIAKLNSDQRFVIFDQSIANLIDALKDNAGVLNNVTKEAAEKYLAAGQTAGTINDVSANPMTNFLNTGNRVDQTVIQELERQITQSMVEMRNTLANLLGTTQLEISKRLIDQAELSNKSLTKILDELTDTAKGVFYNWDKMNSEFSSEFTKHMQSLGLSFNGLDEGIVKLRRYGDLHEATMKELILSGGYINEANAVKLENYVAFAASMKLITPEIEELCEKLHQFNSDGSAGPISNGVLERLEEVSNQIQHGLIKTSDAFAKHNKTFSSILSRNLREQGGIFSNFIADMADVRRTGTTSDGRDRGDVIAGFKGQIAANLIPAIKKFFEENISYIQGRAVGQSRFVGGVDRGFMSDMQIGEPDYFKLMQENRSTALAAGGNEAFKAKLASQRDVWEQILGPLPKDILEASLQMEQINQAIGGAMNEQDIRNYQRSIQANNYMFGADPKAQQAATSAIVKTTNAQRMLAGLDDKLAKKKVEEIASHFAYAKSLKMSDEAAQQFAEAMAIGSKIMTPQQSAEATGGMMNLIGILQHAGELQDITSADKRRAAEIAGKGPELATEDEMNFMRELIRKIELAKAEYTQSKRDSSGYVSGVDAKQIGNLNRLMDEFKSKLPEAFQIAGEAIGGTLSTAKKSPIASPGMNIPEEQKKLIPLLTDMSLQNQQTFIERIASANATLKAWTDTLGGSTVSSAANTALNIGGTALLTRMMMGAGGAAVAEGVVGALAVGGVVAAIAAILVGGGYLASEYLSEGKGSKSMSLPGGDAESPTKTQRHATGGSGYKPYNSGTTETIPTETGRQNAVIPSEVIANAGDDQIAKMIELLGDIKQNDANMAIKKFNNSFDEVAKIIKTWWDEKQAELTPPIKPTDNRQPPAAKTN
jgi:hypothetical protein